MTRKEFLYQTLENNEQKPPKRLGHCKVESLEIAYSELSIEVRTAAEKGTEWEQGNSGNIVPSGIPPEEKETPKPPEEKPKSQIIPEDKGNDGEAIKPPPPEEKKVTIELLEFAESIWCNELKFFTPVGKYKPNSVKEFLILKPFSIGEDNG